MGFKFQDGKIYEMPVFFGPSPVPKNPLPDGTYQLNKPADVEAATVMFETDADKLEALLPDGFTLVAPVLSVAVCEFGNIGNFAGNTYYLINVSTPVRFDGSRDHVRGDLVLAMYENHGEPILGGRDLLGYSKIYADIPRFKKNAGTVRASAFTWDFKFMDMRLDLEGTPDDPDLMKRLSVESEGKFNYKYVQAVPEKGCDVAKGGVDASYPVFNPKAWQAPEGYAFTLKKPEVQMCSGTVTFHKPTPEDMPFYWHIGTCLASLPVKRYLGAQHSLYNDPCDYTHVYKLC